MHLSLLQPTVWRWMIWRTLNRRPRSEWENNWEIITSFTLQNTLTRSFIQKAADSPKKMWTRGKNDFCQMKWIWIFRHAPRSICPSVSRRPSIIVSDFHSVSVSETSQSVERTSQPTWRCTWWLTWRWTWHWCRHGTEDVIALFALMSSK